MEPLGFISQSTENLFKFLFINGLILIGVGMLYPLQMSNDIDLKIVEYNKKVNLLNHESSVLVKDIDNLDKVVKSRTELSKSLVDKRDQTNSIAEKVELTTQINNMKLETNKSFQQIKQNESAQNKNVILVKGDLELISHLQAQQKVYDSYCTVFLILGIVLGVIGFVGWIIATCFTVDKDYHDFKERKRSRRSSGSSTSTPTPSSSTVQPTVTPPSVSPPTTTNPTTGTTTTP